MSAYAGHIASLQKKTSVVASEDIVSEQGALIAKSGAEINQKAFQSIVKFKLLKPLEDSIFIANQLTPKAIFEQIIGLIKRDSYLLALHKELGSAKVLQSCCLSLQKYPILLQKLTVLDMEITDVFNQSLLSAYFASLCGTLAKTPQTQIEENFLAGLVHDVGLLHIDRYILMKQETLTAEEWRKVQSHPVIGFEILKRIKGFPKKVALAVLEHHENLDGSGYPRAKTVHDLGELGQLINLLDSVIVIYNKKFKSLKRSPQGVIPIVQINMHSYLPKVVSSVFQLLKQTPPSKVEASDFSILKDLINHAQEQQQYINTIIQSIKQVNEQIGFNHNDKTIYSIQNIAINILVIINSAGLDGSHLDWLEHLGKEEDQQSLYTEVEDTRLMQGEIIYQLQGYQKSVNVFVNKNPDHTLSQKLERALDVFAKTARPRIPESLIQYWGSLSS